MFRRLVATAAAVAATFSAVPASAQVSPDAVPVRTQVISISPLAAVFGIYTGEYERRFSESISGVIGVSYWSFGDTDDNLTFSVVDAKARFYPAGTALERFSIGGIVGFTNFAARGGFNGEPSRESVNALNAGIDLNYHWLMGTNNNFFVGTGVGAKRLFFLGGDSEGITGYLPTGRIAVGYAF